MTVPPRQQDMPTRRAVENALGRLCTNGLRKWWVLETARVLMGLDCVRAGLRSKTSLNEKDYVDALRTYLGAAIDKVESPQRQIILEVVLGIGEPRWETKEWRKESAKVRRKEAGRRFRNGERVVTAGTIRQHHEPRAIKELATIILADEEHARSQSSNNGPPATQSSTLDVGGTTPA